MPDVILSATRKKTALLMSLQRSSVRKFSEDLAIVISRYLPECTLPQIAVSVIRRRNISNCGSIMIDIVAKYTPERMEKLDTVANAVEELVERYHVDQRASWLTGGVDIFVQLPNASFRQVA